ncbi:MAG: hypothetical protein VYD64_09295 [Pseudomonadota bacterium]|nr:hypothetical protein [Pseudomonadota bacterium]
MAALLVAAACLVPAGPAGAQSGLGVGTRLKGAPSTVSPPEREIAPIYRPNCRWRYVRQSDPDLGWTTRRVRVCD